MSYSIFAWLSLGSTGHSTYLRSRKSANPAQSLPTYSLGGRMDLHYHVCNFVSFAHDSIGHQVSRSLFGMQWKFHFRLGDLGCKFGDEMYHCLHVQYSGDGTLESVALEMKTVYSYSQSRSRIEYLDCLDWSRHHHHVGIISKLACSDQFGRAISAVFGRYPSLRLFKTSHVGWACPVYAIGAGLWFDS